MSRMLARIQRQRLAAQQARAVARALREAVEDGRVYVPGTGGDERRLRGIPAVGRGVAGEIPGTRPDRAMR